MKRFNLSLFFLFFLTTSFVCIFNCDVSKTGKNTSNELVIPGNSGNLQELSVFTLQSEHPVYRLEGCTVTKSEKNSLLFRIRQPGHSVLILKTKAPLMIMEQKGLTGQLRPGWDGTLGYSLYALDVEAEETGSGYISLMVQPEKSGFAMSKEELDSRMSRFPESPKDFSRWKKEWKIKLANRLMNGGLPASVPLSAEVEETEDNPLFTLRRVRYKTQTDRSNTLLLSMPKNKSGRVPLLIALHGHEATWGEADAGAFTHGHADDFCAYFAERGWAVVQPATMNHTLQHPGWTLQGEWTWDSMVALDYALSLPEIDTSRVSVCGLSTGGHLAMNLLALDDRVRSGVVGCVLSSWHHYRERMRIPPHCDCGILDQLGDLIEQCDWAALAAPKPVLFQHGRKDPSYCPGADPLLLDTDWNTSVMPETEFEAIFSEVKKAYILTDEPDNVKLFIHEEGHKVNNESAYCFLMSDDVK